MQNNEVEQPDEPAYTFEELAAALDGPPADSNVSQPDTTVTESDAEPSEGDSNRGDSIPDELTPKALAESLGIDPKELYKSLKIDLGDGNTVSLGELKDKGKELAKVERLRAELTESRVKVENDLLQKRMALDAVARKRGYQLTESDLQEIAQSHKLHLQAQSALLAEIVPEFSDAVARDKGFQAINGVFEEYAFSKAESEFITDARLRKMAYDLHRLRADIAEVDKKEVKPKRDQRPRVTTPQPQKKVTPMNRNQRDAAISQLGKLLG